jgi:uncharacterized protein YbaA (DUF1428 family)
MTYVEGFVLAVPAANKEVFRVHASEAVPLFKEFGATRLVEGWGDDVPDGKVTDFKGAVKAKDDEVVCFSWLEYPDKATRDAATQRMMTDPRMAQMSDMPFDGQRMIFGGFSAIIEDGDQVQGGYNDGFVAAVPDANKDRYREMAAKASAVFLEYGASRVVEAWGDDVPDGKVTDFRGAVKAEEGESIVFSWIEWPSKAARDAAWPKLMEDERMQPDHANSPFDGKRMIYGGFSPVVDA